MSSLRPLSDSVATLTKGTFARKFISLGRILSSWSDIVGPDMATRAQPLKIHYRKPKSEKEKPQASLDIAVSSADATLLHYQKDLILERINQIFGERWITAIRFVHIAANEAENPSGEQAISPISEADKEALTVSLAGVEDEDIRKRLERLGQGVLRKRNKIS
jgi:hypothetical protein